MNAETIEKIDAMITETLEELNREEQEIWIEIDLEDITDEVPVC